MERGKTVTLSVFAGWHQQLRLQLDIPKKNQKKNTYVSLNACLVDELVDVIGGNARLGSGSGNIEDLPCKSAALSHSILARLVEDFDLVTVGERAAIPGVAVLPPHGVGDRLRQSSMRRQRVDRSQRARVGEVRERVVVTGSWIW